MAQKLTAKQDAFCIAYIETGNASEAYRRAYRPKTDNESSIHRLAKGLMDNIKIASRLEELRKPVRDRVQLTLEKHLRELAELRDLAKEKGDYSAATTAETNRGKASGLYVTRLKHEDLPPPTIVINRPNGD